MGTDTARFKADALRAIAERLADRPVEFLPDFAPGDYGPDLTYDRASEVALELLAELGELADLVEAGGPNGAAPRFEAVPDAYWYTDSDGDGRPLLGQPGPRTALRCEPLYRRVEPTPGANRPGYCTGCGSDDTVRLPPSRKFTTSCNRCGRSW